MDLKNKIKRWINHPTHPMYGYAVNALGGTWVVCFDDSSLAEDAAPEYVLALHLFFTLVPRVVETNQSRPKKKVSKKLSRKPPSVTDFG